MNCKQAQKIMWEVLSSSVNEREQFELQSHLVLCNKCRAEFDDLIRIESEVMAFLRREAESVALSSGVWKDLQAKLVSESQFRLQPMLMGFLRNQSTKSSQTIGSMTMKTKLALSFLSLLVILLTMAIFVPVVRGQVEKWFSWFRFDEPTGEGYLSVPGEVQFVPLNPTYLPAGFIRMTVGLNPEAASITYWNSESQQILMIDQSLQNDKGPLPNGQPITVLDQPAVLITGVEGEVGFVLLSPTPVAPRGMETPNPNEPQMLSADSAEMIHYQDASQLVWYVGNIRIEMTSTLPLEELLKIAESLAPAEEDDLIQGE